MADLVFHDPTGRRARLVRLGGALGLALAAFVAAAFFATLAFAPQLPKLTLKDPRVLQALHVEGAHSLRARGAGTKIPHPRSPATGGPARPRSVGFYVSWDENSRQSLADHVNDLDVVSPQWLALYGNRGELEITTDA